MKLSRKQKKIDGLINIEDKVDKYSLIIVLENNGVKVDEVWQLKKQLRDRQIGDCLMEKNKIFEIAAKNKGIHEKVSSFLKGPKLFIFANDAEIVDVSKIVQEFVTGDAKSGVIAGILTTKGDVYTTKDIEDISKMPSLNEIRSSFLGLLQAPQTCIVSLFAAPQGDVLSVIDQQAKK